MSPSEFPLLYEVAGLSGVAFYLLSYGLLQTGVIGGNSYTYAIMNAVAATLVLISLMLHFNLASMLIQFSFIGLSLFGIVRVFFLTRAIRFNDEEKFLRIAKFPTLSAIDTRRFLKSGRWEDLASGTILTTEGEDVPALYFVSKGRVLITLKKRRVATVDPGGFIGEIGALSNDTAGATATALTDLRVFAISPSELLKLCERNPEIRVSLSTSISHELGQKLKNTNKFVRERE